MTLRKFLIYLFIAVCLLAIVPPLHADDNQQVNVIYQSTFSTDPRWITNNPSTDYWDPNRGMYHFSIQPSTGAYAYTEVNYNGGPFTLEYDVMFTRIDDGATFRLGFSGAEMDPGKGPNVLTEFTNAKFGQIMWLHMVTPGNKMVEVDSQHDDTLTSGTIAYEGPTAKYEVNTTYHVTVNYDNVTNILSMRVNDRNTGTEIWGYFINTIDPLYGMDRIYLGSIGDYGQMYIYAEGYIDSVRLTTPSTVTPVPTFAATLTQTPAPGSALTKVTTHKPTLTVPTPYPTATPQSPLPGVLAIAALGIAALCSWLLPVRKK
ncbi:MAG: hypothetical protein ABSB80_04485 [Methanoregula sp.]|jgi:hypothetical protein|uniref:hypothetical protein n=1 Tax=Methanoregula sp. TaxID=2052170 RepID=UPI003D0B6B5A